MEENLWAISIDPDESMREYVLLQLKVRAMRDMLFRSRIFTYLAAATPGLRSWSRSARSGSWPSPTAR